LSQLNLNPKPKPEFQLWVSDYQDATDANGGIHPLNKAYDSNTPMPSWSAIKADPTMSEQEQEQEQVLCKTHLHHQLVAGVVVGGGGVLVLVGVAVAVVGQGVGMALLHQPNHILTPPEPLVLEVVHMLMRMFSIAGT
jgi:hypothetical protein